MRGTEHTLPYCASSAPERRHNRAASLCFLLDDSYHISATEWTSLIRTSAVTPKLDGFFIGLWLDSHHGRELADAGFDGAYRILRRTDFPDGSTQRNLACHGVILRGISPALGT